MIKEQHQRAIDNLVEHFRTDPNCLALIIAGSVAKGVARDDSDVDVFLVTTQDEFHRRKQLGETFFIMRSEICDYPGGYIDGKVIDEQFLHDCADHGSEPARWAFTGAFVAYSRVPGLDEVIRRIPVYQDSEQQGKLQSFYSQVWILPSFIGDGEVKDNPYLIHKAAADIVLFAGRMILAHNRMLFPCHKSMMSEVEKATDKPAGFVDHAREFLKNPSEKTAEELHKIIYDYYGDDGLSWTQALARFVEDMEWNWRDGRPPLQDC
jgi:hypothetical protein